MKKLNKISQIAISLACILICMLLTTTTVYATENFDGRIPSIKDINFNYDIGVICFEFGCNDDSSCCDYNHEIQFSKDPNFQVDCQTIDMERHTDISPSLNNIVPYTTYYFRVREYTKNDQDIIKYTQWSTIKSFNYDMQSVGFTNIEANDIELKIEWTAYDLYVHETPDGYGDGYTMIQSQLPDNYKVRIDWSPDISFKTDVQTAFVDGNINSYTICNYHDAPINTILQPNQTYYFRIRSCITIDGKVYYQKNPVYSTAIYEVAVPQIVGHRYMEDKICFGLDIYSNYDYNILTADALRVQISDSRNFDIILYDETTHNSENLDYKSSELNIANKFLPGKQYYVRMAWCDQERLGPWSTIIPVCYENNSKVIVETIDTSYLSDNRTNIYIDLKLLNNVNIDGFHRIELQYSLSESFDNVSTIVTGIDQYNSALLQLANLPAGTYYTRARIQSEYRELYDINPSYNEVSSDDFHYHYFYSDWSATVKFLARPTIELQKIKATDDYITLNWNGINGCDGYEITYDIDGIRTTVNVPDGKATSVQLINDFQPYKTYYFRIKAYCYSNAITTYSNASDWIQMYYQPTKTYIKHLNLGGDQSVIVDWKTLDYCDGYEIQYADNNQFVNATSVTIADKSEIEKHIEGLEPGAYYFRIRTLKAHTKKPYVYYSNWSNTKSIEFKFTKTYLTSQQFIDGNLKVVWKAVNGDAYEIQYSKNENFDNAKTVRLDDLEETTDKLSYIISDSDFIPGTYYVRVRVVNIVNEKEYYTDWSNAKTVDYKLPKTYIKNLYMKDGQLAINWQTVDNITGYQIHYETGSGLIGGDHNILNSKLDALTMNDCASDVYKIKIRTYKIVDNETYYSEWSNTKTIGVNLAKTYITNRYIKNDQAVVVWKTNSDCDGYEIQASTDSQFANDVQLFDVSGATIAKYEGIAIKPGTTYFRIRTYVTIDGVKYCSDWSNAKTIEF